MGDLLSFSLLEGAASQLKPKENRRQKLITKACLLFKTGLDNYFPSVSTSRVDWVMSPYGACSEHSLNIALGCTSIEIEQLMNICASKMLKLKFHDLSWN